MPTRNLPAELSGYGLVDSGETTLPPGMCIAAGGGSLATGALRLTYFIATITQTIVRIGSYAAVAAAATPSLCRIGVYSVAGNGDIALLHHTANDSSLWSSNSIEYAPDLNSSWSKVAGTRYAIGALCITGATAPTLAGMNGSNGAILGIAPRISGSVSGQTDLPEAVSAGSISNTTIRQFFHMKP